MAGLTPINLRAMIGAGAALLPCLTSPINAVAQAVMQGVGAPVVTSDDGTAQGAVLTASPGATLYRDGIAVVSPYTTTTDDALATFWAQRGGSRSASIKIDSTAGGVSAVQAMRVTITARNDGTTVDCNFSEFQVKDSGGTIAPYTVAAYGSLNGGTIASVNDGARTSPYVQTVGVPWVMDLLFNTPSAGIYAGSFAFAPHEGNYPGAPGDFSIQLDTGSGFGPTFASYSRGSGWAYSYDTLGPWQAIPAAAGAVSVETVGYNLNAGTIAPTFANVVTQAQIRLLDVQDGEDYPQAILDAWTDATSGATISLAPLPDGAVLKILVMDTADPGAATASGNTNVAPIVATAWGSQSADVGEGLVERAMYRDLAAASLMHFNNGTDHEPNGIATLSPSGKWQAKLPSGYGYWVHRTLQDAVLGYGQTGDYVISWPNMPGWTVTLEVSNANVTFGAIDNSARTATFSVIAHNTPTQIWLRFTPIDNSAIPVDQELDVSCIRVSETATGPLSDKAVGDVIGDVLRTMKMQHVEIPYLPISDPQGIAFAPTCTPAMIGGIAAQANVAPWFCEPINATPAYRTSFAAALNAASSTMALAYMEIANETWNGDYNDVRSSGMTSALIGGYVSGIAEGGDWQNYATKDNASVDVTSGTGEANIAISAGTLCLIRTAYHWKAVEVLSNLSIGYTFPDEAAGYEDLDVRYLADDNSLSVGLIEWVADELRATLAATRAEMTHGQEIRGVFAGVAPDGGGDPDWYADRAYAGVADPAQGSGFYLFAVNAYAQIVYDWTTAPADIINYSNTAVMFPAVKTALLAYINTLKGLLKTMRADLFAAEIAKGCLPRNTMRFGIYEGAPEQIMQNIPDADAAAYDAAMEAFWTDADYGGALMTAWLDAMDEIGCAVVAHFAMRESFRARDVGATYTLQSFGMDPYVNAQNDPTDGPKCARRAAFEAHLAA